MVSPAVYNPTLFQLLKCTPKAIHLKKSRNEVIHLSFRMTQYNEIVSLQYEIPIMWQLIWSHMCACIKTAFLQCEVTQMCHKSVEKYWLQHQSLSPVRKSRRRATEGDLGHFGMLYPGYNDMVSLQYEINQMNQFSFIGMYLLAFQWLPPESVTSSSQDVTHHSMAK